MVKLAPRSDYELREWVTALIHRAQLSRLFGTVTITFEEGKIIRARTEIMELPPINSGEVLDKQAKAGL